MKVLNFAEFLSLCFHIFMCSMTDCFSATNESNAWSFLKMYIHLSTIKMLFSSFPLFLFCFQVRLTRIYFFHDILTFIFWRYQWKEQRFFWKLKMHFNRDNHILGCQSIFFISIVPNFKKYVFALIFLCFCFY